MNFLLQFIVPAAVQEQRVHFHLLGACTGLLLRNSSPLTPDNFTEK